MNVIILVWDDTHFSRHPFAPFNGTVITALEAIAEAEGYQMGWGLLGAQSTTFSFGSNTAGKCEMSLKGMLTGRYGKNTPRNADDTTNWSSCVGIAKPFYDADYATLQWGKWWGEWEGKNRKAAGFMENDGYTGHPINNLFMRTPDGYMSSFWSAVDVARGNGQYFFAMLTPLLPHMPQALGWPFRKMSRSAQNDGFLTLDLCQDWYANALLLSYRIRQLLDGLAARGIRENTLIVGLSDNGYAPGKNTYSEDGTRTPICFSMPGTIPEGVVRTSPVGSIDIFPTVCDFAGVPAPAFPHAVSLKDAILNGSTPRPSLCGEWTTGEGKNRASIFDGAWKLYIRTDIGGTPNLRLFNLLNDPREKVNRLGQQSQRAAELRTALLNWYTGL